MDDKVYKILEKSVMPDGTDIQIEDWTSLYPFIKTLWIAAYPVASQDAGRYFGPKKGKIFRCALTRNWDSDEAVKSAFKALVEGTAKLSDFKTNLDCPEYHTLV